MLLLTVVLKFSEADANHLGILLCLMGLARLNSFCSLLSLPLTPLHDSFKSFIDQVLVTARTVAANDVQKCCSHAAYLFMHKMQIVCFVLFVSAMLAL